MLVIQNGFFVFCLSFFCVLLVKLHEPEIYSAFIRLQNKLAANCKNILSPMLRQLRELADKGISCNAQIAEIRKEIDEVKNQRHLMASLK